MKIRPLIIDTNVKVDIRRLIDHAEANPVDLRRVLRTMSQATPAGDDPAYTCIVPVGYRCVFSVEEQPVGKCRHLSVSVVGDGYAPSPEAVAVLMGEFGFRGTFRDMDGFAEERIAPGKIAINLIQKI